MVITKNSKMHGLLLFKEVDNDIAKTMILENHYSHSWNDISFGYINIGLYRDNILLGVAVFGGLQFDKSYINYSPDIKQNEILELNRMWISDEIGKNAETMLISASFKLIKKLKPHVKMINTFADGRLGCGTIYKASNFKYYGYTESNFYKDINTNKDYHQINMTYFGQLSNAKNAVKLNTLYVKGELKVFKVKTYRYIYLLDKNVRVSFEEEPYPEYDKGTEDVEYTAPYGQLESSYLMAKILNDKESEYTLKKYIKDTYNVPNEKLKKSIVEKINSNPNFKMWFTRLKKKKGDK